MNILITGADGFIAKNLIAFLENYENKHNIIKFSKRNSIDDLEKMIYKSDIIFHLAGVNRTNDNAEFHKGNVDLTHTLTSLLDKHNKKIPIIFTSSIQAEKDNEYGRSKRDAEFILLEWAKKTDNRVIIYRLLNVFGKWCKPNYNSVIATFCHNIANGLSIDVHEPSKLLRLVYIDNVINEFKLLLNKEVLDEREIFCEIQPIYEYTLDEIVKYIYSFYNIRTTQILPDFSNDFIRKLYATYTSYINVKDLGYVLEKKVDPRGWLAEFIKSENFGQFFVSKTMPGITRGNHWHTTKTEKFLVISGKALIVLRNIKGTEKTEFIVNGDEMKVIDIPVGYTHSIKNIGEIELVTLFFANEIFNPLQPDTYYLEV